MSCVHLLHSLFLLLKNEEKTQDFKLKLKENTTIKMPSELLKKLAFK